MYQTTKTFLGTNRACMNFMFQWKFFSMKNLNVFSYFDNLTVVK